MTLVKFKYIDLEDRANLIGLKFDPSYKNYIREKAEESIKNNVIYVSNFDVEAMPWNYLNERKENFKILFNKKIEILKSDFDRINYIRTILKDIKQAKQSYRKKDIVYLPEMVNIYNEFDYKEIEQIDIMFEALYLINYLEEELKFYEEKHKLLSILKEEKAEKAEEIENINEIKIPNEEIEYKNINDKILFSNCTQKVLSSIIYMSYYNLDILNSFKKYRTINGKRKGLKNYFIFISDFILFKKKDVEKSEKLIWNGSFNKEKIEFMEEIGLYEAIENFKAEGKKNEKLDIEISNFIEKNIGDNHRLYKAKEALVNHIKEALINQINKTKKIKIH